MLCEGLPGLHPVEVSYPLSDRGYTATQELPSSMLMTEGRVTCVTCHRLDSENHELVVSNRRSALCLTCHRK
jgi:predicted CXXCH cytochrome family protein